MLLVETIRLKVHYYLRLSHLAVNHSPHHITSHHITSLYGGTAQ